MLSIEQHASSILRARLHILSVDLGATGTSVAKLVEGLGWVPQGFAYALVCDRDESRSFQAHGGTRTYRRQDAHDGKNAMLSAARSIVCDHRDSSELFGSHFCAYAL